MLQYQVVNNTDSLRVDWLLEQIRLHFMMDQASSQIRMSFWSLSIIGQMSLASQARLNYHLRVRILGKLQSVSF